MATDSGSIAGSRRVYSADELHNLRGTVSQPRLREAIEEHDGDDAELVKEHILRGSKSFAARSWKSRASAMSSHKENQWKTLSENERSTAAKPTQRPNNPSSILGEIAPNNQQSLRPTTFEGPFCPRPSPTPSIRKQKIESLVKAHGSPDHVRVTAGGRIVPSEQSPLCHPRYGYSAVKVNGGLIKFAPNHPQGKAQWTQATQNGFVAQDVNGRLCQIVDGTILPLHETEAGGLQLYIPAPNLKVTHLSPPLSTAGRPGSGAGLTAASDPRHIRSKDVLPEPSAESQINALELEYVKLEGELKDVDKTEVLHGPTMGKGAKDALVAKRRELVINLDKIRRALKGLKENTVAGPMPSGSPLPRSRLPPLLQPRPQPLPAPYYGAPYIYPAPPQEFIPWTMPVPVAFAPLPPLDGSVTAPGLPQNDGAASFAEIKRVASPSQSHAVPIKAPATCKSTLNPMSPVYKPGNGLLQRQQQDKPHDDTTLTASRIATRGSPTSNNVLSAPSTDGEKHRDDGPTKHDHPRSSSVSSFETADFFPRNTHEFSLRKYECASPTSTTVVNATGNAGEASDGQSDEKENNTPVTPLHAHPSVPTNTPAEPLGRCASPKNKNWLFIAEHPDVSSNRGNAADSSPDGSSSSLAQPLKSQAWLEGYYAGLAASTTSAQRRLEHTPMPSILGETNGLAKMASVSTAGAPDNVQMPVGSSSLAEKLRVTSWPPAHRILSGGKFQSHNRWLAVC